MEEEAQKTRQLSNSKKRELEQIGNHQIKNMQSGDLARLFTAAGATREDNGDGVVLSFNGRSLPIYTGKHNKIIIGADHKMMARDLLEYSRS